MKMGMLQGFLMSFGALNSLLTTSSAKQAPCTASSIAQPEYFGLEVLSLTANEVKNHSDWGRGSTGYHTPNQGAAVDFCNVTVTYTHPGTDDRVNVYIWLPTSKNYNGRFMAHGGGGLAGGMPGSLIAGVAAGYASSNTDSGHEMNPASAQDWALKSPGNVNWQLLQDFADVTLDDMTAISKSVITSFYGKKPEYSYWNGCSNGGRQALVQAQRYPKNYDGILAKAPALAWADLVVALHWAHVQMAKLNYVPPPCEMTAIHEAVIEACDELDGVKDGVISAPGLCNFDASKLVGKECCSGKHKITVEAAKIVNAAWAGPHKNGRQLAAGLSHDMPFGTEDERMILFAGLAQTWCDNGIQGKNCKSVPFLPSVQWITYFVEKNPEYDPSKMTEEEFFRILRVNRQQYTSIMNADWADLSDFRAAGGKMISWHGLADQLLQVNKTIQWYDRVLEHDPNVADFFRFYTPPGVYHCGGGPGFAPDTSFDALIDWVEKGKAPGTLIGTSSSGATRPICLYPDVAQYVGGDPEVASSYKCAGDFGQKKAKFEKSETEGHGEL